MVCEIFANNDKLFNIYIHTPSTSQVCLIIERFKDFTRLQNIASVIERTHILLFEKPNRKVTTSIANFYNYKKFHNIVLHGICDYDKNF
jgi:rRNA maturation protein Rpf1